MSAHFLVGGGTPPGGVHAHGGSIRSRLAGWANPCFECAGGVIRRERRRTEGVVNGVAGTERMTLADRGGGRGTRWARGRRHGGDSIGGGRRSERGSGGGGWCFEAPGDGGEVMPAVEVLGRPFAVVVVEHMMVLDATRSHAKLGDDSRKPPAMFGPEHLDAASDSVVAICRRWSVVWSGRRCGRRLHKGAERVSARVHIVEGTRQRMAKGSGIGGEIPRMKGAIRSSAMNRLMVAGGVDAPQVTQVLERLGKRGAVHKRGVFLGGPAKHAHGKMRAERTRMTLELEDVRHEPKRAMVGELRREEMAIGVAAIAGIFKNEQRSGVVGGGENARGAGNDLIGGGDFTNVCRMCGTQVG